MKSLIKLEMLEEMWEVVSGSGLWLKPASPPSSILGKASTVK
ncbi:MAG: hypothetical protein QW266_01300 [Sulfolobales archaeon]